MPLRDTLGFWLKLNWAQRHLKAFDREARKWINTNPYVVVDERDHEPRLHPPRNDVPHVELRRFRVQSVGEVPDDLPLILGDCVHNLRASLDHLALALALAHTPNMTERQIKGSEFPVFERAMRPDEETKKIGCIAPDARHAIKALQPYHRGTRFASHPLWQIHEMDRIDKHRNLTLCVAVPGNLQFTNPGGFGFEVLPPHEGNTPNIRVVEFSMGSPLERDAILMRYEGYPIDPDREVQVKPKVPVMVGLGDTQFPSLKLVVPTLQGLYDFIGQDVFPKLTKFL